MTRTKTVTLNRSDFKASTAECDTWQEIITILGLPEDTDIIEVQLAE